MHRRVICMLAIAALAGSACASKKVLVPPRVDLTRYGTLGMIEFSSQGSDELAKQASSRFMAVIQGAQPGVPILELGDAKAVLASLERDDLDHETIKAIGKKYGVDAVFIGEFSSQVAKPTLSVTSLRSLHAGADVEGVLSARILQTRSGATIWTNAARGKQSLASLNLAKGSLPDLSGQDLDTAESKLVRSLVTLLTGDFKSRWVKQ